MPTFHLIIFLKNTKQKIKILQKRERKNKLYSFTIVRLLYNTNKFQCKKNMGNREINAELKKKICIQMTCLDSFNICTITI